MVSRASLAIGPSSTPCSRLFTPEMGRSLGVFVHASRHVAGREVRADREPGRGAVWLALVGRAQPDAAAGPSAVSRLALAGARAGRRAHLGGAADARFVRRPRRAAVPGALQLARPGV